MEAPARGRLLGGSGYCEEVELTTQAEVDAFQHTQCTSIDYLYIKGDMTDLRGVGLAGPITVNLLLSIEGARYLQSLEGLGSVTVAQEVYVIYNDNLSSLKGLKLSEIYVGWIGENPLLTTLDGLQGLTLVDDSLYIESHAALVSLHGLDDLSVISGKLHIGGNSKLASLAGLGSVTEAWGGVSILNNGGLKTLQGLNRLEVARHITVSGNGPLEVLGGLLSDSSGGYLGRLSIDGASWPRCIAPQERGYLSQLQPQPHLGMSPEATWESWLEKSCGLDQFLFCWIGLPCEVNLTGSNFTSEIFLTNRTCGPCPDSNSTASVRADATVNLTGLTTGLQPGNYSLCRCLSGETGAGPLAALSIVGPRSNQHFQCIRGSECKLPVVGYGMSSGDSVTVMTRCGGAEVPGGRAVKGSDGEYCFADRGAMTALPPNRFRLCWLPPCANTSDSTCQQVEVGSLRIMGPFVSDDARPSAVGDTLAVANVGDGVDERDRLRLLPQCGQPSTGGLEVASGKTMIFSLPLDASWARARHYRKCWCKPSQLTTCDAPEHFAADSGAVRIVCPPEMEPTETGECRECPVGRARGSAGLERCALRSGYLLVLACYSLVLCSGFVTAFTAAKRQMRIEDVSVIAGRTFVKTLRPHGLRMHGRSSFAVRFAGTAHPGLDKPAKTFRAVRSSAQILELLTPSGGSVDERLDTSRGVVSVPVTQELWHRGWLAPAALLAPFLIVTSPVLLLWERQSPRDVALGSAAAFLVAAAARLAVALLPQTTPLDRRIEDFRKALLKANPRPAACEKGPQRAVELGQLLRAMEFFHAFIRDRSAYYMDGNIFRPLTKTTQLSYAELIGPKKVEWFVSHFWGDHFSHLCSSLRKHAEWAATADTWQQTSYWICFLSNNQYKIKDELGSSWMESSFFLTLQSGFCHGVCMVLDDQALPLTRSWCIFELLQTLTMEMSSEHFSGLLLCTSGGVLNLGQGSVEVSINLAKRIATLDLEQARASCESDKVMINQQVKQELGSFEAMNRLVRQKMHAIISKARENADGSFDRLFALLASGTDTPSTTSPKGRWTAEEEEEKEADQREDGHRAACALSATTDPLSLSATVHVDI